MCLYCNNNLNDKNSIKIINFFKKQKIISDNDNIKLVYGKPLLWGINGFAVLVTDSKMIVFNNFPKVVLHNYSLSSIKNVFIENNQLNINFLDRENVDKITCGFIKSETVNKFTTSLNDYLKNNSQLKLIKKAEEKDIKINYSYNIHNDFVVVDLETTGLNPETDKIIELSAIKYKNREIESKFSTLINPKIHISPKITEITDINDDMVKNSPYIENILPSFAEFVGDLPLVAHNARFDIQFLNCILKKRGGFIDNEIIDTLSISRLIYKGLIDNFKLETIKNYLKLEKYKSHRAESDCIVAGAIYIDYLKSKDKNTFINDLDKQIYLNVKKILESNGRDITYFKRIKKSNLISLDCFYPFFKYKVTGKLKYILTDIDKNYLEENNIKYTDSSASEKENNRIIIEDPGIVFKIEHYILKKYDEAYNALIEYRESINCAEKNINEYLYK